MIHSSNQSSKTWGVVLAGGQSHRMGQDKALLPLGSQQNWLEHSIELLHQTGCTKVWVSGRDTIHSIADAHPNAGPASAMIHCWHILTPPHSLLFIPVDLPYLTAEVLRNLHTAEPNSDAVYYQNHPLPALIRNTLNTQLHMQAMRDQKNISVYQLYQGLNVSTLTLNHHIENSLTNVNTPEQLKQIIKPASPT